MQKFRASLIVVLILYMSHSASMYGIVATQNNSSPEQAKEFIENANAHFFTNPQLALEYALQANSIYVQAFDSIGTANSLNLIGACLTSIGKLDKALNYFEQAQAINTQLKNELHLAKNLNNIGNIYLKKGEYELALEKYFDAEVLFRKVNSASNLISIHNNTGLIYRNAGMLPKALEQYNKALDLAQSSNDSLQQSTILYNMSAIYLEQRNYNKAISTGEESLQIRQAQNNVSASIKSLSALGRIYYANGQLKNASDYFTKALALSRKLGVKDEEALLLQHLGYNLLEQENKAEARLHFLQSLEIARTQKLNKLAASNYQYLAHIDSCMGNYESAMAYQQKYYLLKPETENLDVDAKLHELQEKYEYTRQKQIATEQQLNKNRALISYLACLICFIVLLTAIAFQRVKIRNQQNTNKLTQQNLRSQINPHFIFNVLNSIQYYIMRNDKDTSSNYLNKFARLLRVTLDNSQSNLVPINDEIESLKLYLELEAMRLENELEFNIELDNDIDAYMFKIPTLLLQPFVENSIIHGIQNKQGKGVVRIQLQLKNDTIHCLIEDNGIGRQRAEAEKTEKQKAQKSYGRKISETRLSLLNKLYGKELGIAYSDLTDKEQKPCGTRVEFDLPIMN